MSKEILTYEELARVVDLYLHDFGDSRQPYPNMCAQQVRNARKELDARYEEIIEKNKIINKLRDDIIKMKNCFNCKIHFDLEPESCKGCDDAYSKWELKE